MLKRLLLVPVMGLMLLVAACANMATSTGVDYNPLQAVLAACQTYEEGLQKLTVQRRLGNLSKETIEAVNKSITHVEPVCMAAVKDVPLDVDAVLKLLERELETLALAGNDGRIS